MTVATEKICIAEQLLSGDADPLARAVLQPAHELPQEIWPSTHVSLGRFAENWLTHELVTITLILLARASAYGRVGGK